MYQGACIVLFLLGAVTCQDGQSVNCPTQEEKRICSNYVKELSEQTTTPIHNVYNSKTFFITPLEWNEWEVDQICKVKENYKLYLKCAVDLRRRCVLEDRRDTFMTKWRIDRAIDFLCDFYKCDDCTRKYCERCGTDRYFDFSCTRSKIPELHACMQPYENNYYQPSSSDLERRRWDFNEWQCRLINHQRDCTKDAYRSCPYYTANLTNWFTEYNRPMVCAGTSNTLSAILIFATGVLACLFYC